MPFTKRYCNWHMYFWTVLDIRFSHGKILAFKIRCKKIRSSSVLCCWPRFLYVTRMWALSFNTSTRVVYLRGSKGHKRNICAVIDTSLAKLNSAHYCETEEYCWEHDGWHLSDNTLCVLRTWQIDSKQQCKFRHPLHLSLKESGSIAFFSSWFFLFHLFIYIWTWESSSISMFYDRILFPLMWKDSTWITAFVNPLSRAIWLYRQTIFCTCHSAAFLLRGICSKTACYWV